MGKFNKDKKSGGRRDFGSRDSGESRGFGGRDRERPDMHKATCDECGQSCEVPFKPTGDKPVYCSDCFRSKRGGDSRGSNEGRRDRPSFGGRDQKQMYAAICSGCGNNCEVPFRPTGDKPVYCSQCFDKNKSGGGASSNRGGNDGQLKNQLDALNAKLDKILKILDPSFVAKNPKASEQKQATPNLPKVDKEVKKAAEEAEAKEIAAVIEEMKAMEPKKEKKPAKKEKPAVKKPVKKVVAKKKK